MINEVNLSREECQQYACRKNHPHLWLNGAFLHEGCPNSLVDEHFEYKGS